MKEKEGKGDWKRIFRLKLTWFVGSLLFHVSLVIVCVHLTLSFLLDVIKVAFSRQKWLNGIDAMSYDVQKGCQIRVHLTWRHFLTRILLIKIFSLRKQKNSKGQIG